jgi:hypothetical protein
MRIWRHHVPIKDVSLRRFVAIQYLKMAWQQMPRHFTVL